MNSLTIIALVLPVLVSSVPHHHGRPGYDRPNCVSCKQSGVLCVSKDAFILCKKYSRVWLTEFNTLRCPEGYLCQEGSQYPCVKDPDYNGTTNECDESASTTVKSSTSNPTGTTTIDTTTLQVDDSGESTDLVEPELGVSGSTRGTRITTSTEDIDELSKERRVSSPPECTGSGRFPGPACGQYYECQSYWMLWHTYYPVLKNCESGDSFSVAKSTCVASAESECID
ncbi:hypothetical protein MTP99_015027 [Tenebrio molitor]|nr:hypothetical protein MTP99_015027 [Tenebrio molitor]